MPERDPLLHVDYRSRKVRVRFRLTLFAVVMIAAVAGVKWSQSLVEKILDQRATPAQIVEQP